MESSRNRSPIAREAILEATAELIREHGVSGTSISDVVARSGTSAGAIYHHFGSKGRLVLEVGRNAVAAPMTMIMQTSPSLSPADLFRAAFDQVALSEHTAALLLQIWSGAQSDLALARLLQSEFAAMQVTVEGFVRYWCAEHSPGTDARELVNVLIGLVMGYAVQRSLGIDSDPNRYRELGATLILRAIEPAQPAA